MGLWGGGQFRAASLGNPRPQSPALPYILSLILIMAAGPPETRLVFSGPAFSWGRFAKAGLVKASRSERGPVLG